MLLKISLKEALVACNSLVHKMMDELLPANFNDSQIMAAMRYSALSDGKKIRPFLLLTCAEIFGFENATALRAACAIEFIHVYSLIHDDLPAMDNDNFRRGKPTCHKRFDEATAILAGDALVTYAFEILSDAATHKDTNIRCELIKILSQSAGFRGMVGGQMMDLESTKHNITKEQLANLHRKKTGELFMAACEMGAVLGHATHHQRQSLRYFAQDLGLAFQIRDDIMDYNQDSSNDNHKNQDNTSIVKVIGLENAKKQLIMLKEQTIDHIKIFGDKANILHELAEFVTIA